jgi:hypothetical protein
MDVSAAYETQMMVYLMLQIFSFVGELAKIQEMRAPTNLYYDVTQRWFVPTLLLCNTKLLAQTTIISSPLEGGSCAAPSV